jgi:Brp/Blh family beta-carotene 15,15'-monooxygenase
MPAWRAGRAWVLGLVGVGLWWTQPELGEAGPPLIALALLAGLPHGAVDHQLAEFAPHWRGWRGQVSFHAVYVLSVLIVLAGWALTPVAGLLLLLLSAAWHFGESDLLHLPPEIRSTSHALGRGALIVLAPMLLEPEAAMTLFASVSGKPWGTVLPLPTGVLGPLMAAAIVGWHLWTLSKVQGASRKQALTDAVGIALLVCGGGPMLGFALYFTLWHTPDHFAAVARSRRGTDRAGWRQIAWDAAPRTLVALAGMVLLVAVVDPSLWARFTVWVVAALTLPHALVVHLASSARALGAESVTAPARS